MKKVEEKNSLMNQDHHQYDIDVTNDKVAIMNVSKPKSPYKGNDSLSKSPTDFTLQNKNIKLNNSPEKGKINRTNLRLNIKPTTNQQNAVTTLSPNTPGQNTTPKPINVVVFLKEGTDYKLWLEKGKLTTAEEIKLMMMKELSVPDYAKHFFAIWLISPHLELQLKGHHIPFLLRVQWHDLLSSLSYCEEQEAILDEPVLVFQRSSFLSEKEEEKNSDEVVVKRLFEEARYNILNARYPVPVSDAEWLGGILAHIEEGPYKESVHKPGCFKNSLSKYLPYYAIGSNKVTQRLNWSTTESHLLNQYKQLNDKNQQDCKKMFLSYCQRLPFYGCAFFKGSFRMNEKTLWKNVEKSIKIGINRLGLSIFKSSKEELIRFLPYDDISWGLLCKEDENDIDSLCLEFDCGKEHAQQIFIDSKQAKMMDAMVESCVKYMDKLKIPKTCLFLNDFFNCFDSLISFIRFNDKMNSLKSH